MRQRIFAVLTRSLICVLAGNVDSQYFVGSTSFFGHSISSHSSSRGRCRRSSRCAGHTRTAAKRELIFPLVPSRQHTVRQAFSSSPCASAFTLTDRKSVVQGNSIDL